MNPTTEFTSPQINEIAGALSKVQAALSGASRDKKNPHLKYLYADLASCWEACRETLAPNGLSVTQVTGILEGQYVLYTMLLHVSGQWIKGYIPLINKKEDMQGLGSAMTYARRYGLCAVLGISPEDDDGTKACEKKDHSRNSPEEAPADRLISSDQIKALDDVIGEDKSYRDKLLAYLKTRSIHNFESIPVHMYGGLLKSALNNKSLKEKEEE